MLRMHVCFCCVCFSFSVLSQEIGWEEHFRNDLFCVQWDVKTLINQSVDQSYCSSILIFWFPSKGTSLCLCWHLCPV